MGYLKPHTVIKTQDSCEDIEILPTLDKNGKVKPEGIGEGGQGCVYEALYNGKHYALKWYYKGITWCNPDDFYENLQTLIRYKNFPKTFLWPEKITQRYDGCFGYLMPLLPKQYAGYGDSLINCGKFSDFTIRSTINCAMQMLASFRFLHNQGLAYLDLNNGNIFINPENGDVLLCDNDNVVPNGKNMGISGKEGYMAPEVIAGHNPDTYSDLFSLALVLFRLLFIVDPLFGKNNNLKTDPLKNWRRLYCEKPVFILDPNDNSNRPHLPEVIENVELLWHFYPKHTRELFIKAFSKPLMLSDDPNKNREQRISEQTWLKEFARLRSELLICPHCGAETFGDMSSATCVCSRCKKTFNMPPVLETERVKKPLQAGQKLYSYELNANVEVNISSVNDVVARVIENKLRQGVLGIHNESSKTWTKHTPAGKVVACEDGNVIPVARGIKIEFAGHSCTGTIR